MTTLSMSEISKSLEKSSMPCYSNRTVNGGHEYAEDGGTNLHGGSGERRLADGTAVRNMWWTTLREMLNKLLWLGRGSDPWFRSDLTKRLNVHRALSTDGNGRQDHRYPSRDDLRVPEHVDLATEHADDAVIPTMRNNEFSTDSPTQGSVSLLPCLRLQQPAFLTNNRHSKSSRRFP